jgi:ferric-dicitrate binding protein FerR (iron transport regulator)
MNRTQRFHAFLVLFLCVAAGGWTQQAVIRDLAGTVEVKKSSSAVWENAQKGQALETDTMISTGFRSTALIALGNSLLTVRPLTRLTLEELSRMQNDEKVELRLQTGGIRAEVSAAAEGKTDFTVRSSAATASVRGTVFEFDTFNLRVIEGSVEFSGAGGGAVMIGAGRRSYADERLLRPLPPEDSAVSDLKPPLPFGAQEILPHEPPVAELPRKLDLSITVDF